MAIKLFKIIRTASAMLGDAANMLFILDCNSGGERAFSSAD